MCIVFCDKFCQVNVLPKYMCDDNCVCSRNEVQSKKEPSTKFQKGNMQKYNDDITTSNVFVFLDSVRTSSSQDYIYAADVTRGRI